MNTEHTTIDEYLAGVPEKQRKELQRIRNIVKETVPQAAETISYGMPTFKYKHRPLIHFAAFKDHLSVFPTSGPIAEFEEKLKGYKTAKGTIQFTAEKPLPEQLIKDLLQHRIENIG